MAPSGQRPQAGLPPSADPSAFFRGDVGGGGGAAVPQRAPLWDRYRPDPATVGAAVPRAGSGGGDETELDALLQQLMCR